MGSKTGWIIAAVLVLTVVGIIVKAVLFPSPTAPTITTLKSDFMDRVDAALPLTTVIANAPGGGGNAGDDYKAAFDVFQADKSAIVAFLEEDKVKMNLARGTLTPPDGVLSSLKKIGGHVAAGARKADFEYTLTHTRKKDFEVGYFYQGALDLGTVFECASIMAIYQFGIKQYDQAARTEKDLVVMGWHMTNERARLHMTMAGFEIQLEALGGLRTVYLNSGRDHADELKMIEEYRDAVRAAKGAHDGKIPVFQAESIESGDILNIAENHKDRAMRVQGILFLGRLRHEVASHRGDMRYTYKLLDHYDASSDPFEAAAAKAAREMTKEQWENLSIRVNRMDR